MKLDQLEKKEEWKINRKIERVRYRIQNKMVAINQIYNPCGME